MTPPFFVTLGIELLEGRLLGPDDVDGAPGAIVVTDALARRVYPGESAVGKLMTLRPDGGDRVEIVGVVSDVRYRDVTTSLMADANSPDVFFSFWQLPTRGIQVAARVRGEPVALYDATREVVGGLDPELPIFRLQPLREAWRAQTATPRFAAFLMSLFSGMAALLACVGIYGVLDFTVGQRAQEIAIRRAIGASGARVARSVVLDGLRLAAMGLLGGSVAALCGTRWLASFLFGVAPTDAATFATVGAAMVLVATGAAVVPAARAMRRHPAEALTAD